MNVVPDLLGDFRPSLDLSISVGEQDVEAGVFVDPKEVWFSSSYKVPFLRFSQTIQPPQIKPKAFHKDERLYTLIMVDPGLLKYQID